ncbi:hypothetical protein J3E69DRAFT_155367 [Trichoderma sp. SZMC 28015]
MFPIACGLCLDLSGQRSGSMWLGWERVQPNFDAQSSHQPTKAAVPLPVPHRPFSLPPISFPDPNGYDCFERRLAFGQQSAEPNQKPALTPRSCASLLKVQVLVLQGDKIHESTLLLPPPKSRLASITRVMKQPREFATLVLSFAVSHRLVAAFLSSRLAPLTLIRHLVPPTSPAVHNALHRHTTTI